MQGIFIYFWKVWYIYIFWSHFHYDRIHNRITCILLIYFLHTVSAKGTCRKLNYWLGEVKINFYSVKGTSFHEWCKQTNILGNALDYDAQCSQEFMKKNIFSWTVRKIAFLPYYSYLPRARNCIFSSNSYIRHFQ